jgi:uncharacterized cupin superfamily protein
MTLHLHAVLQRVNANEPEETCTRSDVAHATSELRLSRALSLDGLAARESAHSAIRSGLTKIGINHTTLPPGKESSMRHWHTHEDEFIFVLSGEVVVKTDAGEQVLGPACARDFPLQPMAGLAMDIS